MNTSFRYMREDDGHLSQVQEGSYWPLLSGPGGSWPAFSEPRGSWVPFSGPGKKMNPGLRYFLPQI